MSNDDNKYMATAVEMENATETKSTVEEQWTPAADAEKKLLRKLDITILPWIMLMYFLSYMDR